MHKVAAAFDSADTGRIMALALISVPMFTSRKFPPRVPTQVAADGAVLNALGRRIERLFFVGLLVTVLAFATAYFNVASQNVAQDENNFAVTSLIERVTAKREDLEKAYKLENDLKGKPAPPSKYSFERAIAEKRKKLGLPPEIDEQELPAGQKSYRSILDGIFIETEIMDRVSKAAIEPYKNYLQPPAALLQSLTAARAKMDTIPVKVWGITTNRYVELKYYGSAFQLPFQFISQVMFVLLCPLVAGWLTSLYMTRQREIQEIKGVLDIANVFPHVLNFVPIYFSKFGGSSLKPADITAGAVIYSILRISVMVVLVAPMLFAWVRAAVSFWSYSSWAWVTVIFLAYIPIQALSLLILEAFSMGKKYFSEP